MRIEKFFLGKFYPVIIAALCFLSHISSLEWLFGGAVVLLATLSLVWSHSLLPVLAPVLFICFHISRVDSAAQATSSDSYFSGVGILVLSVFLAVFLSALAVRLIKKLRDKPVRPCELPFFGSALLLISALFIGGFGSGKYTPKNLLLALFVSATLFLFFYLFYIALRGEEKEKILEYLCRLSAISAFLIGLEVAWLYIEGGVISGGEIVKEKILFGWGIWNTAGSVISVLIPNCFLGLVLYGKRVYLVAASLAYLAAIFTLSRGALILSSIVYIVGIIVALARGKYKKQMQKILLCVAPVALTLVILFSGRIFTLFSDFFERGFSDNGRFALWRQGLSAFLSAPLFGNGFFGVPAPDDFASSLPGMLHSTPVQLLCATGIFGFLAYVNYRVQTLRLVFKNPSFEKTMLALSILTILLGSLLDNFVFYMHTMLYPSAVLAAICRLSE